MKRFLSLLLILLVLPGLVACGGTSPLTPLSGGEIAGRIIASVEIGLPVQTRTLDPADKDLFSYHFFIAPEESIREAVIVTPTELYANIPFFLGILKTSSAADASRLADACKSNADLHKLTCAPFVKADAVARDTTVFFVMDSDPARADLLLASFQRLADNPADGS